MSESRPDWFLEVRRLTQAGDTGRALGLLRKHGQHDMFTRAQARELAAEIAKKRGLDGVSASALINEFRVQYTSSAAGQAPVSHEQPVRDSMTDERIRERESTSTRSSKNAPKPRRPVSPEQAERLELEERRYHHYKAAGLAEGRAKALAKKWPGPFTVIATGISKRDDEKLTAGLQALGYEAYEIPRLLDRIEHVASETVAFDLDQTPAVRIKKKLEAGGAKVRIEEAVRQEAEGTRRRTIPELVRHEVWRRDQGCCVECGSRERLEFDHIIPVAEGGSNTARNIELRCETCNRRKGARI